MTTADRDVDDVDDGNPVELVVPLPDAWEVNGLDDDQLRSAETELQQLLAGRVEDAEEVASSTVEEFLRRVGGGSTPLLLGSFRADLDDGTVLAASLTVARYDGGASLARWAEVDEQAVETTVADRPALRTFDSMTVQMPELFAAPVTAVIWRYLVEFDARSLLMFTLSSPNGELADDLLEYFEEIMSEVEIDAVAA